MRTILSSLTGLAFVIGLGAAAAVAQSQSPAPSEPPASSQTAPVSTEPTAPGVPTETRRSATAIGTLPQNLSPWGMFLNADIIVQAVMVGLGFASVVTWTVWLAKSIELLAAVRTGRALLARFGAAGSLDEAVDVAGSSRSAVARLARAAAEEADASHGLAADGLKERIASRLDRLEAAAGRRMMRGTGLLATIGATAPFVGLFGTVWGIMNAFVGISKAQTTNLAVVAPGIAEALLATAIGLVAAIPAVVIYNVFARWITGYRHLLADASAEIMRHVSRDLDRARRPMLRAAE